MRRGSWLLAAVSVSAFVALLAWVARPLLFRPSVEILLYLGGDAVLDRAAEDGLRRALAGRDGRAGVMKVVLRTTEPEGMTFSTERAGFHFGGPAHDAAFAEILLTDQAEHFEMEPGAPVALDLMGHSNGRLPCLWPDDKQVGRSVVLWAKARGARRLSVLWRAGIRKSVDLVVEVQAQARREGLELAGSHRVDGPVSPGTILEEKPDFVFDAGEEKAWQFSPELFLNLRNHGFRGTILAADPQSWSLDPDRRAVPPENVHVISRFPQAPPGFGSREEYAAFLLGNALLDSIDSVGLPDRIRLRREVELDLALAKDGRRPSVWIVRNGKLEFVEEAP